MKIIQFKIIRHFGWMDGWREKGTLQLKSSCAQTRNCFWFGVVICIMKEKNDRNNIEWKIVGRQQKSKMNERTTNNNTVNPFYAYNKKTANETNCRQIYFLLDENLATLFVIRCFIIIIIIFCIVFFEGVRWEGQSCAQNSS